MPRTINGDKLTSTDHKVISLAEEISKIIQNDIEDLDRRKDFYKNFGKIHYSRDAGIGLGGGKLQRDALTTRGRSGKAPFSNRNLRWHPLLVSENKLSFAKEIERIEIDNSNTMPSLIFVVKHNNVELKYPSKKVHELPEKYVCLPEHWLPHHDELKTWNSDIWGVNNCVIPSLEACNWWDAVEAYAVLSLAQGVANYNCNFESNYNLITEILSNCDIFEEEISLPTENFPTSKDSIIKCPVCKKDLSENIDNFRTEERIPNWNPGWSTSKRSEGRDSALQILHAPLPLIDNEIRHNANNIKYGHRWCNIMMTDHTLSDFTNFAKYIVDVHGKH